MSVENEKARSRRPVKTSVLGANTMTNSSSRRSRSKSRRGNDNETDLTEIHIIATINQLERQKLYALSPSSNFKKEIQFFEEALNEWFELLSFHGEEAILRFKTIVRYETTMTALKHEEEKPKSDIESTKNNNEQPQHIDGLLLMNLDEKDQRVVDYTESELME
jgi:hypothetical protein